MPSTGRLTEGSDTAEEARHVTEMVRRIAVLVLMQPELDANCERVTADVWEWRK